MPIDIDDETATFKRMMQAGLILLMAMYLAWGDVKFWIWGTSAEATVTKIKESPFDSDRAEVQFRYRDTDGRFVDTADTIPYETAESIGDTIQVDFLTGDPTSASLARKGHTSGLMMFSVCLLLIGWRVYPIWVEARDAANGVRRRRRAAH